jgi:hypothetical protein
MIDGLRLQIYWPKEEREFCQSNEPFLNTNGNGSGTRKYKIINPENGESLQLIEYNSSPYCLLLGSWRRWFFGDKKSLSRDLTKREFFKALRKISNVTGISIGTFLSGEIKNVELGFITRLDREHDLFLSSLTRYGRLDLMIVKNKTVKFFGTKKSFICYDKGKEILPKLLKKKQADKILKRVFFMRMELKIKAKSGTEYKDVLKNLYSLYNNWDFLLEELCDIIQNRIERIDVFSDDLDLSNFEMTYGEQRDFLVFQGIKNIGFENAITLINRRSKHRSKISNSRKLITEIYHRHKSANKHFVIEEIFNRIRTKANYLKS